MVSVITRIGRTSDKYTITLRNNFDAFQEISEVLTPNYKYDNFVNVHMETEAENIPTKTRTRISLLLNTPTQAESLHHRQEQAAGGIGLHVNADKM